MEKLVLVGYEPLRLALPTPREIEVVDQFTRQSEELEELQRLVAKWSARAINDLQVTDLAAASIFNTLSAKIETKLSDKIPEFEKWSLVSSQPRFLARGFWTVSSLHEFLERGFGVPDFIKRIREIPASDAISDLHEFLLASVIDEINLINEIEIAPNIVKLKSNATSFGFGEYNTKSYNDFTHTFIWKTNFIEPSQCRVIIKNGRLFNFVDSIQNMSINARQFEMNSDRKSVNFDNLDCINRDLYLRNARRLYRNSFRTININDFIKHFNKELYSKILELDLSNNSNFNYIEEKIYNGIIKGNLNRTPTDSDSTAATASKLEKAGANASSSGSLAEKLAAIDEFAAQHPGAPVSDKILETFPELLKIQAPERVTLPSEPPAHWPEDRIAVKGVLETPPDFIRRNYAQWLGKGLTRADIRRLDKPLSTALDNWLRRNPMPDDLDLPTLKEQNSRWIDRIEREGIGAVSAEGDVEVILKHGQRLLSAKRRRERD